jgi:murein DD-endopeptidase MepM/ murein hydrolase activator NlpD
MDALSALAPLTSSAGAGALDGPGGLNRPGAANGSAKEAGEAFEAYLVGFMAQQMRAAIPDGPMSTGPAAMFADLFDQEIGKRVASGPGLGLKDEIERALNHRAGPPPGGPSGDPLLHAPADPHGGVHVTSGFGLRTDPFDHTLHHHDGADLRAAAGSPVTAARDGTVRFAGKRGGYGNVVIVDHGAGVETRYAHCASLAVRPGDVVHAGDALGTVGSTGRSTGPHLHFEVRENGTPIDPAGWLSSEHVVPEVSP